MNMPAHITDTMPTFHDIYSYHYPPIWQTSIFYSILFFVFLIIISIIAIFVFYKKRGQISPEEWAFSQLKEIKRVSRQSKQEYQQLYFSLTKMIKGYLFKRFEWRTINKTDKELLDYLEQQGFDQQLLEKLQATLQGATRIKFANEEALQEQAQRDFATTEELISMCTPKKSNEK